MPCSALFLTKSPKYSLVIGLVSDLCFKGVFCVLFSQSVCSGWLRLRGPVLGAAQPPVIITENNIQFSNPALPPPPPWLLSAPHSIFGTLTHSTVHLINFIQNVICNIYQINGTDPLPPTTLPCQRTNSTYRDKDDSK